MTVWTVEKDERGWSVVQTRDGRREEVRRSLAGLPCITAQVIAAELESAYERGREDERADIGSAMWG